MLPLQPACKRFLLVRRTRFSNRSSDSIFRRNTAQSFHLSLPRNSSSECSSLSRTVTAHRWADVVKVAVAAVVALAVRVADSVAPMASKNNTNT